MAAFVLSLLLLPLATNGLRIPWAQKGGKKYALEKAECNAFQGPSPDVVVDNYLPISRAPNMTSRSSIFFDNVRRANNPSLYARDGNLLPRQTGELSTALGGSEYLVGITFGGQAVQAILDTGSSDTWLVQSGFTCIDASGNQVAQSTCNFGPLYNGGFSQQIQNQNFQITYGDGEVATGSMGYQSVTIAGITVPSQEVALVNRAYWNGDGVSTGLVGLAFAQITSAYQGTDPSKNSPSTRITYDPLFTTMWKQGLSAPTFSLALQRNQGGYIAFGGLPPVTTTGSYATTPLQNFNGKAGSAFTGQSFYTITPDALVFSGAASKQSNQYIIDSGTTLNYLPSSTAMAVNSLFSPKATLSNGIYTVSCNAKPPVFGVKIGGQTFVINPVDMILQDQTSGQCVSAIQDGGAAPGPFILGDAFLNNVVAVFDVGAAQMRFAKHIY
ncbi:uncharacterized protein PV09_02696 [Verruconis gallopava]|uniref:Peptidase A1 domain-containing protein n=1 Tax=Verruconis gallopava TaxID=253628 RepID=A0A0D2AHZ4_9PEZI|nr:uncharacterized protein PV09_02696 [Verruconis gallopava]KIW06220.1 hypothetical protein PV09_02696 [Verruconis gallopava]